ncbi:MAG TPA: molybdenum cofactor biosynthesis protein MoaE [Anaerolineae bacterium]|nr:molybdenum cofactor biosynthesis protein MoaE [Anaerolineae bacterium]HQH39810.1 molybdenum cofactor biosynthesis protein MoaE [Anaerolineae bacterium]
MNDEPGVQNPKSKIQNLIEITAHPISTDEVVARVADPANGAVVTFIGVVRGVTGGRQTLYLEYEAYPEMAEKVLRQIADEIHARWPDIRAVAMVHRVGRLEIGETAVVIALAASHRAPTFDALRYAIDRIKEIAPIWKKEFWADGAAWRSEH